MSAAVAFGLGLTALGVFWPLRAVRARRLVADAARWPPAEGVVLESSVHRGAGSNPVWEARIRYACRVGSARVESNRVTLAGSRSSAVRVQ